jgi:glycosyl transferase family 25
MIPILVINLDRDRDRLEYMRNQFDRIGMSFERLPAVHGVNLPPVLRPFFCDLGDTIVSPLMPGQIGCHASHLLAWMTIVERDLGPAVLICEDDVVLPADLPQLLESLITTAPEGWDIIRLSTLMKKSVAPVAKLYGGFRLVRYWRITVNAGAYLISRKGAAKMIRPGIRKNPLDVTISRPWVFGTDCYGVIPRPIVQEFSFSSSIDRLGSRNDVRKRRSRFRRFLRRLGKIPTKIRRGLYNFRTMGTADWLSCVYQNALHKATGRPYKWSEITDE